METDFLCGGAKADQGFFADASGRNHICKKTEFPNGDLKKRTECIKLCYETESGIWRLHFMNSIKIILEVIWWIIMKTKSFANHVRCR